MLQANPIQPEKAWLPDLPTLVSFSGGYRPIQLSGPSRLVRLLCHAGVAPEGQPYRANRIDGTFWFDEQDFFRIKREAYADLQAQGGPKRSADQLGMIIGMYMRHQFRDLLAVRRDWTPSFDYYATLALPPGQSVVALAGMVAGQPVYSDGFDGAATARKAGVRWRGGFTQYVIRFDFPPNQAAKRWIQSPRAF